MSEGHSKQDRPGLVADVSGASARIGTTYAHAMTCKEPL